METAQIARTLVDGKLWSAIRGMDRTGVDDPEAEQNIIRAEQTDAALNPAAVQVMAQLAQPSCRRWASRTREQAVGGDGRGRAVGSPAQEAGDGATCVGAMGAAEGQPGSGEQPMPAARGDARPTSRAAARRRAGRSRPAKVR